VKNVTQTVLLLLLLVVIALLVRYARAGHEYSFEWEMLWGGASLGGLAATLVLDSMQIEINNATGTRYSFWRADSTWKIWKQHAILFPSSRKRMAYAAIMLLSCGLIVAAFLTR
jgi:hypothetical protein